MSDHKLDDDAAYWVCAYANNQHEVHSDVTSDPSKSSFVKAIELAEGRVLTVLDESGVTYQRIWCCLEIFLGLRRTYEVRAHRIQTPQMGCHSLHHMACMHATIGVTRRAALLCATRAPCMPLVPLHATRALACSSCPCMPLVPLHAPRALACYSRPCMPLVAIRPPLTTINRHAAPRLGCPRWWQVYTATAGCHAYDMQHFERALKEARESQPAGTPTIRQVRRAGWPRMASDGLGWPRMASDGLGWPRMASDGLGWPRVASGGLGWPRMASDGLGWPRMASDGPLPLSCPLPHHQRRLTVLMLQQIFDHMPPPTPRRAVGLTSGPCEADKMDDGKPIPYAQTKRQSFFPRELVNLAFEIDVQSAMASRESDRKHILNYMAGRPAAELDEPPLDECAKYTQTNARLHGLFAAAAWRLLLEHGDTDDGHTMDGCAQLLQASELQKVCSSRRAESLSLLQWLPLIAADCR